MKRNLQAFFCSLLSAGLLAVSIPNELFHFGIPLAALFSLVPLYFALNLCNGYITAGLLVSLQFVVAHVLSSFWLSYFKGFAIFTLGGTSAVYLVSGFLIGQILYIPFDLTNSPAYRLKENSGAAPWAAVIRVLLFAAAWTVHEWGKSTGFLAYPWGTLIMGLYRWKLLTQIVDLTGTRGLSFLAAIFSALVAEGITRLDRNRFEKAHYSYARVFCAVVLLFMFSSVYGIYQFTKERIPEKTVDMVLVQVNADSWENSSEEDVILASQTLTRKALNGRSADLVVWSETTLSYLLPDSYYAYEMIPWDYPLVQSIMDLKIPHLIGAPWIKEPENFYYANAAVLFDKDGDIADYYLKTHLVPFAEVIPYYDTEWMQNLMNALVGFSTAFVPGDSYSVIELPLENGDKVSFAAPICFEDAFPSTCRQLFLSGSDLFVNITNDSWSLTDSAEYQHFVISSYRAQEFRTTLVRSTNSGYSVVVDPAGRVIHSMPLFQACSSFVEVPVYQRQMTVYALLGDWVPLFAALILLFVYAVVIWRKKMVR
ncbi:MAG: apolipoprotein N-acyltransferase [Treponemataceae bacterium]|nr:apolipoprotein N-acyltransferase [Treponemataceae bacterium]